MMHMIPPHHLGRLAMVAAAALTEKTRKDLLDKLQYILKLGDALELDAVRSLVNAVYAAVVSRVQKSEAPEVMIPDGPDSPR